MIQGNPMVIVDEDRCEKVVGILSRIEIPAPDEDDQLSRVNPQDLPNFYFAIVAICHQTSPVGGVQLHGRLADGREKFGWDYLRLRWADRVAADPTLNTPRVWERLSSQDLQSLLADETEMVSLTDAEGRALLLRDMGEHFRAAGLQRASDLLIASKGRLESLSPPGLYDLLSRMQAYRDPVRKKSSFFLDLMRTQCGWRYLDATNLGAPIDYHEVRGHLRVGTVVIQDAALLDVVRRGVETTAEQDLAIRMAVHRAIQYISRALGKIDAPTLHYLFWNLFRRCCGRTNQHCDTCGPTCGLPARYRDAFAPIEQDACVLNGVCASAGAANKLIEHVYSTDYF